MARSFRLPLLLPAAALVGAAALGGCVAYPAYPAYGYGYPGPYYGGTYVAVGGGWRGGGWHEGWHGGGWSR